MERYGKKKTKDYCLEFNRANHEIFYYPLKNKYSCLTTPNTDFLPVLVAQGVTDCIDEYYDYPTERCLEQYEAQLNAVELPAPTRRRLENFYGRSL